LGLLIKLGALAAAFSFSPDARLLFTTIGVSPLAWAPYFVWYLLALLLNSFNEELIYRAYAIENTKGIFGLSAWGNVLAASLVFSLMHFLIESPDWLHFLYRLGFGIVAGLHNQSELVANIAVLSLTATAIVFHQRFRVNCHLEGKPSG
jgi:hypothetical protein